MGIKLYTKWMRETHSNSFKKKWLDFYDNVYIDINFVLHLCHYGASNQQHVLYRFGLFIDRIINVLCPTKTVIFAGDGVPPIAKLLLQRKRRLAHVDEIIDLHSSSLIFTPNTIFMSNIENTIKNIMKKYETALSITTEYYIECSGEAELKLKKKIMEKNKNEPLDTHIIISNDADVIAMFSTFDYNVWTKIFILNDTKTIDIISVGHLLLSHMQLYGYTKTFGLDFTTISILLGNDYLPKILCNDLTKIWSSYRNNHMRHPDGLIINNNLNIDFLIDLMNGIINRTKPHWLKKYTINDFNYQIYSDYLEGVLWCVDMYDKGECCRNNYMFKHNNCIIHPLGIILVILSFPETCEFKNIIYPPIKNDLYGYLVFPEKATILLNKRFNNIFEQDFMKKLCNNECENAKDIEEIVEQFEQYKIKYF